MFEDVGADYERSEGAVAESGATRSSRYWRRRSGWRQQWQGGEARLNGDTEARCRGEARCRSAAADARGAARRGRLEQAVQWSMIDGLLTAGYEGVWKITQEVHRRAMEATMKEAEGGEQGQG